MSRLTKNCASNVHKNFSLVSSCADTKENKLKRVKQEVWKSILLCLFSLCTLIHWHQRYCSLFPAVTNLLPDVVIVVTSGGLHLTSPQLILIVVGKVKGLRGVKSADPKKISVLLTQWNMRFQWTTGLVWLSLAGSMKRNAHCIVDIVVLFFQCAPVLPLDLHRRCKTCWHIKDLASFMLIIHCHYSLLDLWEPFIGSHCTVLA